MRSIWNITTPSGVVKMSLASIPSCADLWGFDVVRDEKKRKKKRRKGEKPVENVLLQNHHHDFYLDGEEEPIFCKTLKQQNIQHLDLIEEHERRRVLLVLVTL